MGPLALLLGVALAEGPQVRIVAPRGTPRPGQVVPLWVALSEDGAPLSGVPVQLTASAGELLGPDGEIAPGLWQVRYRAPATGDSVELLATALSQKVREKLTLAPQAQPSVSAPPLLTGTVGGALSFDVEGADLPPPEQLQIVASEGRVASVERVGDRLHVTWTPGTDPFPRVVPIGVRDRRQPADAPAWVLASLRGRARVPIQTEPGSRVTVRVGGRSYGPVTAGADGVAMMVLEVRPGEDHADVQLSDEAGNVQESVLNLGGSTSPALVLVAEDSLPPQGAIPPVYLHAIEADGRPWRGAAPSCTTSLGDPGGLAQTGPGSWTLDLPALPADAFFDVRVDCSLERAARASLRVPVDNALPSRLTLRTWPDELTGDNAIAQVLVALENGLGERVAGEGLSLRAQLGSIQVEETPGLGSLRGLYDGSAAIAAGGDTLEASWNLPLGEGRPWDLVLTSGPVDPGATSFQVAARALDRRGLPLPGIAVTLDAGGGPVVARTDARGWARASLSGSGGAPWVIVARVAGLERRAVAFVGAGSGPDPEAPDLHADKTLPIHAGRVREVFLSADPPVLSAGGGQQALIVVRLLDRAGHEVTDLSPRLEATAGTLSAPRPREDGSFEATYTPPPGMPYGTVNVTATGAVGSSAEFRGTTTLEIAPREVKRATGVEVGGILGGGPALSPWLSLEFDQRLPLTKLPLFLRVGLGTYGRRVTGSDDLTGSDLDMDLRFFPATLGVHARSDGRRLATWLGMAAVVAPYQLDVRLDQQLIIQGPGFAQPGFAVYGGVSRRLRVGEVQLNARYMALSTGVTDAGWQGNVGGVIATLGYRLLY